MLAAWGWMRVLTLLWIGFLCLLRPGEICEIRGGDIMRLSEKQGRELLIRIGRPKRRVGGARQEYAKIDEEDAHPAIWAVLSRLKPGEPLWQSSPKALALRRSTSRGSARD